MANLLIGDCSPGAALLLARHVDACPKCAIRMQAMGAVGGMARDLQCDAPEVLQPSLEIARVRGVSGLGEAVYRLRAQSGERLNLREPLQAAEILLLEGALVIDGKRYVAGDYLSLEDHPAGELVSDAKRGCVCLITCAETDDLPAD